MKQRKIIIIVPVIFVIVNFIAFDKESTASVITIPSQEFNNMLPSKELDTNTPFPMETPPFSHYLAPDVPKKKVQPLKLMLSSEKRNKIIDDDNWFIQNKLQLKTYQVPNPYQNLAGNLPSQIETTWKNLFITSAFYDNSYIYCTYGAGFDEGYILRIYDANSLNTVCFLDLTKFNNSPDLIGDYHDYRQQQINWAIIKDNILYFSMGRNIEAKGTYYKNAYITAINLSNKSIVWRSDPLISNADNFIIIDDVILCGYGYTGEADFLYQINRSTGEIIDKIKLKTAPTYIIDKDKKLYVRTYNTDYIFDIVTG